MISIGSKSFAQTPSDGDLITKLNNIHEEMVTCVAFYKTVSICMDNIGDHETSQAYTKAAENLLENSIIIGLKIGLSQDAIISRNKLASNYMYNLMEGKCINISSALSRYVNSCPELAKNPLKSIIGE